MKAKKIAVTETISKPCQILVTMHGTPAQIKTMKSRQWSESMFQDFAGINNEEPETYARLTVTSLANNFRMSERFRDFLCTYTGNDIDDNQCVFAFMKMETTHEEILKLLKEIINEYVLGADEFAIYGIHDNAEKSVIVPEAKQLTDSLTEVFGAKADEMLWRMIANPEEQNMGSDLKINFKQIAKLPAEDSLYISSYVCIDWDDGAVAFYN